MTSVPASAVDAMTLLSWAAYRQDGDSAAGENDLATSLAGSGWTIVRPSQVGLSTLDPDNEYFEVHVGGNSGPVAAAFLAQRNGVLVIAFRGSDESGDQLATINNQSGYFDAYRNFLDAALLYAADPANGVTQILATGHSLGGVMAEWFANEYALTVSTLELPVSIATFGSPGTSISTPPTALAQSIVHFGHAGDQIFQHQGVVGGLLSGLDREGTSIGIDLPNVDANDPRLNFFEHDMFLYQRSASALASSYFGQRILDDPTGHQIIVDTVISAADDQITLDFSSRTVPLAIIGDSRIIAPGFADSDTIWGGSAGDWIDGGRGNDTILGGGGSDELFGGSGADFIAGGTENDQLLGGAGADILDGGTGNDIMMGGSANDIYAVDSLSDVITENPGDGTDTAIVYVSNYILGPNVENGNVGLTSGLALYGNGLDNVLSGHNGDDFLAGLAGNDTLYGGAGADILDGGAGNDTMVGGAANDIYAVDSLSDVIIENPSEGIDVAIVYITNYVLLNAGVENIYAGLTTGQTIYANDLQNLLSGNTGNDFLAGFGGNDTIYAGAGDDIIDGGAGNDTMVGGTGNDTYAIDSLSDIITENTNAGTDTAIVYVNNYVLAPNVDNGNVGLTGGLTLTGNGLANTLVGNSGPDTLDGAAGIDTLWGSAGNDTFVFHRGEADQDAVMDLNGNGSAAGDQLQFVGYGTLAEGATFTEGDATHWSINSADGLVQDVITLANGASIHTSDYIFL